MSESALGLTAIVALYATIGALSAVGSIHLSQRLFSPRTEQRVFALFLVPIAAFYLAFTAYFGNTGAWPLELKAVAAFTVIALLGLRFPWALVIGYPLHGAWDLLHELQAHSSHDVFLAAGEPTAVPLAYGVFCAVYDLSVSAYAFTRRRLWQADRAARAG